jgi:hypothetical protein
MRSWMVMWYMNWCLGHVCVGQVVQALRKVASLGRAVVCTIHQPSAELFFHFDDLLLLQVHFCPVPHLNDCSRLQKAALCCTTSSGHAC